MVRSVTIGLLVLGAIYVLAQGTAFAPAKVEDRLLLAEINREEGIAFLEHNAGRPGVVVQANGMQVEVLRIGEGATPEPDDRVSVHYRGWHIDDRLFESTYRLGIPGNVPIARTIPGWQTLLTSIPVGSHVRVALPPELAYGPAGGGRIGPEETIIFEIELLDIVPADEPPRRDPSQQAVPGLG